MNQINYKAIVFQRATMLDPLHFSFDSLAKSPKMVSTDLKGSGTGADAHKKSTYQHTGITFIMHD